MPRNVPVTPKHRPDSLNRLPLFHFLPQKYQQPKAIIYDLRKTSRTKYSIQDVRFLFGAFYECPLHLSGAHHLEMINDLPPQTVFPVSSLTIKKYITHSMRTIKKSVNRKCHSAYKWSYWAVWMLYLIYQSRNSISEQLLFIGGCFFSYQVYYVIFAQNRSGLPLYIHLHPRQYNGLTTKLNLYSILICTEST